MKSNEKQLPPITVDLNNLEDIICPICGGMYFDIVHRLKKVPAMLSRSSKEETISIALFRCITCGFIKDPFKIEKKQTN